MAFQRLPKPWSRVEPARTRTRPPRPVLTPRALRNLPNSSLEPASFCRDASRNLPLSPHHPPGTRRNPRRNLPKNTTGPQRDTILVRKRRPGTRSGTRGFSEMPHAICPFHGVTPGLYYITIKERCEAIFCGVGACRRPGLAPAGWALGILEF